MGGFYVDDDILDYDVLYCEDCGDSDRFIGEANSFAEAWDLVWDKVSIFGSGGVDLQSTFSEFVSVFNVKTKIDAEKASEDKILREIGRICGKPVRVFCISEGTESKWGYDLFVVGDSAEDVAREKNTNINNIKEVSY